MVIFSISINPLLHKLDDKLLQLRGGRGTFGTALITYADDVTIVLRNPSEIQQVREILHTYTAAPSARLNIGKSTALALGTWNASDDIMGITYSSELNFLGTKMTTKISRSAQQTWNAITGHIKLQAKDDYYRALAFDERINYVQMCMLSRAWYAAQVFPPPPENVRQIKMGVT
jgi:hypothetical protein